MKFTLSWLKDHLDTQASLAEIVETLTRVGLEVESVEDPGLKYGGFVVGRVIEAMQHPNADRLRVCVVEADAGPVQVVCGAPNARTGMKSVFSPVGTYIPGNGEVRYKAGKWPRLRRVIIKAEVVRAADKEPRDNPRFVITNMKQSPQWIYEQVYCQRGDIENRIKELHELEIDRTSCTSFWANQFRVLLTAAAYVLMQELRLRAAGTACARAQVGMLRERLLKLGARVLVSVRRVVVHLPASFPFLPAFSRVALALGAATG